MMALPLFGALVVARLLTIQGRDLEWTLATAPALLWEDAFVALLFAVTERVIRHRPTVRALYALLVAYVALNVPLARLDGGQSYLNDLANAVPTAENVLHYARMVRESLYANARAQPPKLHAIEYPLMPEPESAT
jgi:hypothetical protein